MDASESEQPRLLLVDDHQDSVTLQALLLRRSGYEVITAANAATARGVAAEHRLDLVVTDIRLPDGHGADLMRELHDRYGLRGIALTGAAEEAEAADWRSAGLVRVLLKPVAPEQLTEAVQAVLEES